MKLDVSIVLGPPPTYKRPIVLEQLMALAARRADVEVRTEGPELGNKKVLLVFDPTGAASGELFLVDGRLQIRNPDEATLRWMIDLGHELGGRVRDNMLKTYRSPTEKYAHPDDEDTRKRFATALRDARNIDHAPRKPKRSWFRW